MIWGPSGTLRKWVNLGGPSTVFPYHAHARKFILEHLFTQGPTSRFGGPGGGPGGPPTVISAKSGVPRGSPTVISAKSGVPGVLGSWDLGVWGPGSGVLGS